MKLLKQFKDNAAALSRKPLNEEGAGGGVGAGGVAGMAMPLFATLVQHNRPKKKISVGKVDYGQKKPKKKGLGLAEAYRVLSEQDDAASSPNMGDSQSSQRNFDNTEVIAKLKGLERKEETDQRDTVSFGLEDDEGGVVRVTVKQEQAEDFERALQSLMVDREDEDGEIPEIAEVLFKLKDHFDIVDVKWPEVVEDEEQQLDLEGGEGEPGMGMDGEPGMDGEMGLDAEMPPAGDTGQVTDLLTQVIDMMKADAEARKAEARAREAEAKTKEAGAIVAQTMARVKQEEQYLDMESQQKAQKEQDKEAKRLAQLAKWKSDMSQSDGGMEDDFAPDAPLKPNREVAPEDEERAFHRPQSTPSQQPRRAATVRGRVAPHDIAQFIIGRVK
jgi:hypothetical protein